MKTHENAGKSRMVIWGSTLSIAGFLIWANWAELDQITRTNGQVIASSRNQVIQAPDGGVMAALPVREGAQVKRGEILVRFDKTRSEAGYLESAAKAAALKATVARLNAEIFGGEPKFPPELAQYPEFRTTQLALFKKRQAAVSEEISALEQSRTLIKAELDMNMPLIKTGDVSRAEILKLQRQAAEIQGQITNRRNKYLQDIQTDLAKAQEDLAGTLEIQEALAVRVATTEVLPERLARAMGMVTDYKREFFRISG